MDGEGLAIRQVEGLELSVVDDFGHWALRQLGFVDWLAFAGQTNLWQELNLALQDAADG